MRIRRRILGYGFVLALFSGVAVYLLSRAGSSRLESWIGSQLQELVNSEINPKLSFAELDYTHPFTVSLKNLRLSADDPRNAGQPLDIIACNSGTLVLAEVPRVGKPLVIEKVVLDKPVISIVAIEPRSKKFVGFSPFVREPTTAPTTRQRARLSEFLSMRLVQVIDGKVVYDPRVEGAEPMELDQISTGLKIEPTDPGWYKLGASISRKPVLELSAAGQVNLDTFSARDVAVKLRGDVGPDQVAYLPPQLQKWLNKYQVRGSLEALVLGEMPILRPTEGQFAADVTLTDGHATFGQYQIPITRLEMTMRLEDHTLHLPALSIEALRGKLEASGRTQLNEQLDSQMKLVVAGMMIQDLLAGHADGKPPKFAGKVDADIQFSAPARAIADRIRGRENPNLSQDWGTGTVKVNEGELVSLPTLSRITQAIRSTMKLIGGDGDTVASDTLTVQANLSGDKANVTEMTYVGDMIAARGRGTLGLDQTLDLTLNAGPIEKVQDVLGQTVGGAIAKITDKIVSYHVTGKLGQPQVEVQVAGGSIDKVGTTIDKIGEGIGDLINPRDKQQ